MHYTLHQLQIFLEVVKHKSVTQAAEELHMTQPALSIQLKNFQQQFNIPLTEKIGRNIHITDFGMSIAKAAKRVLEEAQNLSYKTKEFEGLLAGKLKISAASTGKYVIPYFLTGFQQAHTGIDLLLDVSNKTLVIKSLLENKCELALVSVLPEGIEVYEEQLLKNELFLVGNTPDFDESKPLIYREDGSATLQAMNLFFNKTESQKSIQLTSNEAVKQAVIAGLGYSILPIIGIRNEIERGQLHKIDRPNLPITTYWRLIWLKKKQLSPVSKAFIEYVKENKRSIIAENFS
jgi:DNA-binding transcriptional LysR family regulator